MALEFVGSAEGGGLGGLGGLGGGGSETIDLPVGTTTGDIVIVCVVSGSTSFTPAINTSGYNTISSGSAGDPSYLVAYKIMGETPDTSVEIANKYSPTCLHVWRGVDVDTPEDATATTANGWTGNPDCPSITTNTNGAVVIACGFVDDDRVHAENWTAPSGYTNLAGRTTNEGGGRVLNQHSTAVMAAKTVASAGAEDPAAFSSAADDQWRAVTVALRPAEAGGGGGPDPLTADSVSWTYTASDASLEQGYEVAADAVSWTWSPQDTTLRVDIPLTADAVAWSWTITDAALEQGYALDADAVSWTYTVTDASLEQGFEVAADAVSWSWSPQDATLTHAVGITLAADSVAWSWTAGDASLEYGQQITADAVSWNWTVADVTLTAGAEPQVAPRRPVGGLPLSFEEWARAVKEEKQEVKELDSPPEPKVVEVIGPVEKTSPVFRSPELDRALKRAEAISQDVTRSRLRRLRRNRRRQEDDWFLLD